MNVLICQHVLMPVLVPDTDVGHAVDRLIRNPDAGIRYGPAIPVEKVYPQEDSGLVLDEADYVKDAEDPWLLARIRAMWSLFYRLNGSAPQHLHVGGKELCCCLAECLLLLGAFPQIITERLRLIDDTLSPRLHICGMVLHLHRQPLLWLDANPTLPNID